MTRRPLPFDAVLLLSFGGPDGPDDVLPFLENVTRGRNVPRERLAVVAGQYDRFGGRSPINDQNRALLAALRSELEARGRRLPIYWGNRNWEPFVEDTLIEMAEAEDLRVLAVATSAYSSYSSCRQYHEDIARAQAAVAAAGLSVPEVVKIRPYWNHPGFIDAMVERVRAALAPFGPGHHPRLVFTAHSIPTSMATGCDYEAQLRDAAQLVVDHLAEHDWDLAFQSRSGPPQVPWLEPDIVDHLEALASDGVTEVVVVPIGFMSDHMEVRFDLDTQAAEAAERLGITMVRAGTVGTHPRFVSGLVDILDEHLLDAAPQAVGTLGLRPACAPGCCPAR